MWRWSGREKICDLIIDKYFIKNKKTKEFLAFQAKIYALYQEMKSNEGLDIISLVKERAKDIKDNKTFMKLDKGGFSEVYLIFDLDPHDTQYEYNNIMEMIKYFDNETENGKLYINYPMMESLKHFKSIPDYNTYTINIENV